MDPYRAFKQHDKNNIPMQSIHKYIDAAFLYFAKYDTIDVSFTCGDDAGTISFSNTSCAPSRTCNYTQKEFKPRLHLLLLYGW